MFTLYVSKSVSTHIYICNIFFLSLFLNINIHCIGYIVNTIVQVNLMYRTTPDL